MRMFLHLGGAPFDGDALKLAARPDAGLVEAFLNHRLQGTLGRIQLSGNLLVGKPIEYATRFHLGWEGEYRSELRTRTRMLIIVPFTVLLIFIILYSMHKSLK